MGHIIYNALRNGIRKELWKYFPTFMEVHITNDCFRYDRRNMRHRSLKMVETIHPSKAGI